MSRFDRRLGTGSFSPRPGTANCKVRPKKKVMLNSITEDISKQTENATNMIINDVSEKNERILRKLEVSRNPTERILLNHELRLNTMELNVDCLNNLDCDKDCYQSQIDSQKTIINNLENKLLLLEEKLNKMMTIDRDIVKKEVINDVKTQVTMDIEDVVKKTETTKEENDVDNDSPTFE